MGVVDVNSENWPDDRNWLAFISRECCKRPDQTKATLNNNRTNRSTICWLAWLADTPNEHQLVKTRDKCQSKRNRHLSLFKHQRGRFKRLWLGFIQRMCGKSQTENTNGGDADDRVDFGAIWGNSKVMQEMHFVRTVPIIPVIEYVQHRFSLHSITRKSQRCINWTNELMSQTGAAGGTGQRREIFNDYYSTFLCLSSRQKQKHAKNVHSRAMPMV